MDHSHFIAFATGISVGGFLCGVLTQRECRRIRRQTTDQMKSATDTQDLFYATTTKVCRVALLKLESGDTEGAKQELGNATATFYHSFRVANDLSKYIAGERREIEIQARTSATLAAALGRNPDEKRAG